MKAWQLKRILEAVDDDDEISLGGYDGDPWDVEYVQVFETGEVWIIGNIVSADEMMKLYRENEELKKQVKILKGDEELQSILEKLRSKQ